MIDLKDAELTLTDVAVLLMYRGFNSALGLQKRFS